jgi:hypothetical protein
LGSRGVGELPLSHTVTPVLVDLQELRAAFGSRDECLIETIVERSAEEWTFDEDDESGKIIGVGSFFLN